ncbi:Sterol 3-beta-glucosyltransferase UGT80B1 [Vitis vinifera]|uniref:Sterol 3-beta-glucosyltransferase UGT80B1 n=1 Tax=Vitis vinifera TaxID=29760 RepID=A0A438EMU1_VITVI|nr:Sterol 3-beta-glucosyltransferase UGT80B1 [Vitis vinifera]
MSCLSTIQDHFADEFHILQPTPLPKSCNIDVNLHSFSYHGTDPGKGIVIERDMHCELKPYKFKILGNCPKEANCGYLPTSLCLSLHMWEFGHYVRLATHSNFCTFVKSAGVDFYPLGGDPRVLAGYMARNKGFIPAGPGELSVQRKQLKAIIESLLPACIEPDIETGVPFRAQAIIANPPAYGYTIHHKVMVKC